MPDTEGRLSPAEIEFVRSWIQRHHGGTMPACPVSRHQDWHVVPQVHQSPMYPVGASKLLPDTVYPYVFVLCAWCGYVMSFNANMMGLYPQVGGGNVAR